MKRCAGCCCHAVVPSHSNLVLAVSKAVLCDCAANGNGMPPPPARVKADDDDIFGDAGTDYVCELPKVGAQLLCTAFQQKCSVSYAQYACCTSFSSALFKHNQVFPKFSCGMFDMHGVFARVI